MKVVSKRLERLLGDWQRRRMGVPFMLFRHFDPNDFGYAIGIISLVEISTDDPTRFFYRVHGAKMAELLGVDLTGRFIDDAPDQEWTFVAKHHFEQVLSTGGPSIVQHFNEPVGQTRWVVERMVLPLSTDGAKLDMLLTAFDRLENRFSSESLQGATESTGIVIPQRCGETAEAAKRLSRLTPRQRETLEFVVEGCSNKEIAARLNISQRTVEVHRACAMRKMEASSLAEAIWIALSARELNRSDPTR